MIEVILVSVGFVMGFIVTTFSHKSGVKSVSGVYKTFINPPLKSGKVGSSDSELSSDSDEEPYPFYNFEDYENYVETNGLEHTYKEEQEIDESKFEDLKNE